jgi:transposase
VGDSDSLDTTRGSTTRDLAQRFRVSEEKIRKWIELGEIVAINTAAARCGRPRWIITPEAVAAFERRRAGGPTPKPQRQKARPQTATDYYP